MDYSKRIKELRESYHLTQEQLAHAMGLETPNFISQIETGKKKVGLSVIQKFSNAIGIELSDFFREAPDGYDAKSQIPVIDLHTARVDKHFDSTMRLCSRGVCSIARPQDISDANAYGAIIRDDSMCPALIARDVVIASPAQRPKESGLAVVGLVTREMLVRRVRSSNGMMMLECCNPSADHMLVKKSDIEFIHPILWVRYQMPLAINPHF